MRPITVSVGALASASATKISASQAVPGATAIVIDGAAASGYSATAIATTTGNGAGTTTVTLNGARAMTINGATVAYMPTPAQIVLVSAGNDSTKTWTVSGLLADGRTGVTETVAAANASRVATTNLFRQVNSVTLSAASAGNVSVGTNGVATLDLARRVILTSGGADTGLTFTVYGTDRAGNAISEAVTGASGGAASTVLDYKTVTKITSSGATASTLTVGTNGVAASGWIYIDPWAMSQISLQATVVGTVNYDIQSTLDDPNDPTNPVAAASMTWVASNDTAVVGATATKQSNFAYPPKYIRVLLNSGSGSVTLTANQPLSAVL